MPTPRPRSSPPAREPGGAYRKAGRTRKPISFRSQASCRAGVVSCRGDAPSHATWISWQSGSQKGSANSRKILLLVPKPSLLMASAFPAGSGGSKKVSSRSLRNPGIHRWAGLTFTSTRGSTGTGTPTDRGPPASVAGHSAGTPGRSAGTGLHSGAFCPSAPAQHVAQAPRGTAVGGTGLEN